MRVVPQFRLRTLLVLVAMLGCLFGWLGVQFKWKHDRHAEWQWIEKHENGTMNLASRTPPPSPPLGLRIIGETALDYIPVDPTTMSKQDWEHLKIVQSLFPEAEVVMSDNIVPRDQLEKLVEIFRQQRD
jgi:hypothetical protein